MTPPTSPLFPGLFYDAATRIAALCDHSAAGDGLAWRQALADGWTSVLVAEAHGGVGGTLADAGAIVEGLAGRDAWLPAIERCVVAPLLLEACPGTLSAMVSDGTRTGVLAAPGGVWPGPRATRTDRDLWRIEGAAPQAGALGEVDRWLLAAHADGQAVLLACDARDLQAGLRPCAAADGQPLVQLADGAAAGPWTLLASGPAVAQAGRAADMAAMFLTCVDSTAALAALLQQTVGHLQTRVQFGASLSSQQVLRHRAVDLFVVLEAARGLVARCLRLLLARSPRAQAETALAKLYLGTAGRSAAEAAIQLHGAIGMSEELPAARLARRIVVNDFRMGDRMRHDSTLAATMSERIEQVWA